LLTDEEDTPTLSRTDRGNVALNVAASGGAKKLRRSETYLAVESPASDNSSTDTDTDTSDSDSKYEEGTQITGFSQRVTLERPSWQASATDHTADEDRGASKTSKDTQVTHSPSEGVRATPSHHSQSEAIQAAPSQSEGIEAHSQSNGHQRHGSESGNLAKRHLLKASYSSLLLLSYPFKRALVSA